MFAFYYIFINTISSNDLSARSKITFWPKEIHFTNYVNVSHIPSLMNAFKISLGRTVIGTLFTVAASGFLGYMFTRDTMWNGTAMIFIPVDDQNYYADADAYYGSGRVFGVGSGVDDEKYKTIMEFLDWYASPEGLDFQHAGIKDFNCTVGDDGKYTAINDNALMDNLPVPEEYGGAGYSDGNNQINEWIVASNCTSSIARNGSLRSMPKTLFNKNALK